MKYFLKRKCKRVTVSFHPRIIWIVWAIHLFITGFINPIEVFSGKTPYKTLILIEKMRHAHHLTIIMNCLKLFFNLPFTIRFIVTLDTFRIKDNKIWAFACEIYSVNLINSDNFSTFLPASEIHLIALHIDLKKFQMQVEK